MRCALVLFILSAAAGAPAIGLIPAAIEADAAAGRFSRGVPLLEQLAAAHPDDAEVQFRYGEALLGIGRAEAAKVPLARAVEIDPANGAYHRTLGLAYLKHAKQMADSRPGLSAMFAMMRTTKVARDELLAAVERDPRDLVARMELVMYFTVAPGVAGGSHAKALEQVVAIERADPLKGLRARALHAELKRDHRAAEELLHKAAAIDPTNDSRIALGRLLATAGRPAEALEVFALVQRTDPANLQAWYQFGKTAGASGLRLDEGLAALQRYLAQPDRPDTEPTTAFARFRLGQVQARRGRPDLAQAEFDAAAELGADDAGLLVQIEDARDALAEGR